ncbi:MAG: FAD-binding protein, partial [Myxococcales bacterium]|nr:FAD-binding protein [Myxococcales bacterium]
MAGAVIHNWARTHSCRPQRVARPENEAALRTLVREAAAAGSKIKVIGARHSWSDIAMSEGVLVSLDAMQELLAVDLEAGRVRVQAGVRLHRLVELLAAQGLALAIVGSVLEQSIAGVMATGTHGSSLVHGNIPSHVVGLRMVTAGGEILELGEGDPRLRGARVGLGALGVITEVRVRVEPLFRLRETTQILSFDEAVASVDAIARSAEYVKLWWLPHTDAVMVFRCERTREPGRLSPLAT